MRYSRGFRLTVAVLTSVCVLSSSGCSLFVGPMQTVTITPSDPNAVIEVDGQEVGRGTVAVPLDRRKKHAVVAKTGDKSGAAAINKKLSGLGVLDIVGGCLFLVPFLGVFGAGFWDLEPQNVQVIVH